MVPPKTLDGATPLAVADLMAATATGSVRLFRDCQPQDSNRFAYLALAMYEGSSGCYVFYCDEGWQVLNDMLYDSRLDAEDQVHREFVGVEFTDL
jgi:hypothetical protein